MDALIAMGIVMGIFLIFLGASVGKRHGLKYWLFDGADGFSTSIFLVLGAFITSMGGWAILIGLGIFGTASYLLYDLTSRQVYTKKDLWILLLGKISFALVTFGVLMFIAILLGGRKKK